MSFPFNEDEWADRPVRTATKSIFTGWGLVALIIGLCFVIAGVVFGLRVLLAPATGRGEQIIQVNGAQNRTQQYNHFYDLYGTYNSQVTAVQLAKSQLDAFNQANPPEVRAADLTGNLQSTYAQDQTNLTGAEQICTLTAQQYNQDSRKTVTGAQFKAWDLPDQVAVNACQVAA